MKEHGALPASYAKNFKRGLDRFLCLHLGIDPSAVEQVVRESADDEQIERGLARLLPADVRAAKWNRDLVAKGDDRGGPRIPPGGAHRDGLRGQGRRHQERPDLIDFDEGIE